MEMVGAHRFANSSSQLCGIGVFNFDGLIRSESMMQLVSRLEAQARADSCEKMLVRWPIEDSSSSKASGSLGARRVNWSPKWRASKRTLHAHPQRQLAFKSMRHHLNPFVDKQGSY